MPRSTHPAVSYAPAADRATTGRPGGGPPRVQIDEVALYNAALTHAAYEHLGTIFGVSGMRLSQEPFRTIIERARAVRRQELLAAQFDTAIRDRNPTMQIWLGKQYLDQKDVQRVETTGPDGGPVQQETTVKAIAYFPENNRTRQVGKPTTQSAQRFSAPPDPASIPTHGTADIARLAQTTTDPGPELDLVPATEPIDTVKRATGLLPARAGAVPQAPAAPPGTPPAPQKAPRAKRGQRT